MDRHDDSFDLPENLKSDLRGLFDNTPPYRGDDQAILSAARSAGRPVHKGRRWAVGIGIAAAVAIAAILLPWGGDVPEATQVASHSEAPAAPALAKTTALQPYTATGDIRDAYFVARSLQTSAKLDARWDTNGDGSVDSKDSDALAAAAVSLSRFSTGEVR
jgi:hypothetical protein